MLFIAQFTQFFGSIPTVLGKKSLFKHNILLKLSSSIFSFLSFFPFFQYNTIIQIGNYGSQFTGNLRKKNSMKNIIVFFLKTKEVR